MVQKGEIEGSRNHAIDLLKTIAMFGVITIHTCGMAYGDIGSVDWLSRVFWGVLTRSSVPVFLMCSGVLFLNPDKDIPTSKIYTKYIPRVLIAMIFWGTAYKACRLFLDGVLTLSSLWQGVKEVFLFNQEYHFYYLHIILLLYAFVPIIRIFIKNAKKRDLHYFLLIWFVLGIFFPSVKIYPPLNQLTGIPLQWQINMAYASIGYSVLGYYIYYFRPFSRKTLYAAIFLSAFIFVFFITWYLTAKNWGLYTNFLEGMSVGVCLMAAGFFGFCTLLNFSDKFKIFNYISEASFCIYLFHVFVMGVFYYTGLTINLFPAFFSIPVFVFVNMLICTCVFALISHVPIFNKWII